MQRARVRLLAAMSAFLALSACATSPEGPKPLVDSQRLANACEFRHALRGPGQVTFTINHRLYATIPSGRKELCVADDVGAGALIWGPKADRVLAGGQSISKRGRIGIGTNLISPTISAPTGRSVVYVSPDHSKLVKAHFDGAPAQDVSFLSRHDEIVYHPAGTHIAAVGTDTNRSYGLWLATNVGKNPRQLARAETARRLYSLSYGGDGSLAFSADHGDRFDVHLLTPGGDIQTVHKGREEVRRVVDSPFDSWIAFSTGACSGRTTTHVFDGKERVIGGRLKGLSTEPVGWLPDGRLVVLAREKGCTGQADVYVWSHTGTAHLVDGVDQAAARAAAPPPPSPPGPSGEAEP